MSAVAAQSPSSSESQVRVAGASPVGRSNERTNGRTHVTPTNDCAIPEVSDVRARVQAMDMDDTDRAERMTAPTTAATEETK